MNWSNFKIARAQLSCRGHDGLVEYESKKGNSSLLQINPSSADDHERNTVNEPILLYLETAQRQAPCSCRLGLQRIG